MNTSWNMKRSQPNHNILFLMQMLGIQMEYLLLVDYQYYTF